MAIANGGSPGGRATLRPRQERNRPHYFFVERRAITYEVETRDQRSVKDFPANALPAVSRRPSHLGFGFTLLELLVVIAIIGLLAAYVGPKYYAQVGRSEQSLAKSQIEAFSRALGTYRLDVGSFPTTEEGLVALERKTANANKWNGPYLDKVVPTDPWGRPYVYRSPSSTDKDFDIESYGKDGQPGGSGENADVTN